MPKSILVHIGCTSGPYIMTPRPPEWMEHCVEQYFTFNDDDLYILTDQENFSYLPHHSKVIPIALEDYESNKIDRFHVVYEHVPKDFWTTGVTRYMYLENFMRENNLQHIYYFEYDTLIYFNIAEYHDAFRRLYSGIAITPESPKKFLAGFMYIDNYEALAHATEFFVKILEQYGEAGLSKKCGVNVVHDMLLWAEYDKTYTGVMAHLPILPFGEHSQGFDEFKAIFDPVTWGEFTGGTRTGGGAGQHSPGCYIAQVLEEHPDYTVIWETKKGLRCPYFSYDGNLAKMNNIHVHSKNLAAFMSKEVDGAVLGSSTRSELNA